jgi:uncharacterized membrane protein YedE/YeeE
MNILRARRWSPYAVGAGIGVLSWFSFLTLDRPLGVSTGLVRLLAMLEGPHAGANPYLAKLQPLLDYEVMLVLGLLLGAWASARLSGDREEGPRRPAVFAFLGGFILMFGARLAGGCTSGHGISGGLQLAVSGWTFFLSLFAGGVVAAFFLYQREVGHE